MGRTSHSGPVYGAKGLLAVVSLPSTSTAQSDAEILEIDVPSTEDWLVTRVAAYCTDEGSDPASIDVEDDGTTILTGGALTLASDAHAAEELTADAGEDEGVAIAAGSTVTVDITTGDTSAPTGVMVHVEGYRRYVGPGV